MGHIWVGPNPAPLEWMKSWIDFHPDWEYTLYDNEYLRSRRFRTAHLIEAYWRRKRYEGVSDLIRYEILYEYGGFLPSADTVCLRSVDELFGRPCAYTVYENEFVRGKLVSPILACQPGNSFVGALIERLERLDPSQLEKPWKSTGNLFVAKMIQELNPDIIIFPSHYFIPVHFTGVKYEGGGPVYAKEMFGTTREAYPQGGRGLKLPLFERLWGKKYRKKRSKKYYKFNEEIDQY